MISPETITISEKYTVYVSNHVAFLIFGVFFTLIGIALGASLF